MALAELQNPTKTFPTLQVTASVAKKNLTAERALYQRRIVTRLLVSETHGCSGLRFVLRFIFIANEASLRQSIDCGEFP